VGAIDHGNQDITYNYYEEATAEDFNKRHLSIRPRGIYNGGYLTKVLDTRITLSPFALEIGDNSEQISSKSSVNATLDSETLDSGSISSATPFIVFRWAFAETIANYVEVHAIASLAAAQDNDIVIGKCEFSGATLTGFDYSCRTFLNVQDIVLRVEATSETEMRVRVRAGRVQTSSGYVLISEQKTGLFAVPSSPNSRIDLVYITDAGAIAIQQGTATPSPSAPDYNGKLVLAEVRVVNGDTNIPADRITDVRSFISSPMSASGDIFGSWTTKDSLNNALVADAVYKADCDGFMSFSASAAGAGTFGYTDSSNPPTTAVAGSDAINSPEAASFPVKSGEYCKVSTSGGTFSGSIRWLPIGAGNLVKQ